MQYKKGQKWEGRVVGVYRSETKGSLESTPYLALEFADGGVVGDKHFGFTMSSDARQTHLYPRGTTIRNNRQWSAVSVEELLEVAQKMGVDNLKAEWLGANLLTEGVPNLTQLPPLSMVTIRPGAKDSATLIVHEENFPCMGPHRKIVEKLGFEPKIGFVAAAMGRRGVVGWIEKAGTIAVGDALLVQTPDIRW